MLLAGDRLPAGSLTNTCSECAQRKLRRPLYCGRARGRARAMFVREEERKENPQGDRYVGGSVSVMMHMAIL